MGENEEVINASLTQKNCGIGNILYRGINAVYDYANFLSIDDLTCNLYWGHYKDNIIAPEHFEDEETTLDVFQYLHKRIIADSQVKFNHVISVKKYLNKSIKFLHQNKQSYIKFYNPHKTKKNKICFWGLDKNFTSTDASGGELTHNNWRHQTYDDWIRIREFLSQYYEVIELNYRLPIREVYYHICTSEFTIGYAGAFHALSVLLRKPNISIVGLNNKLYPNTMEELHKIDAELKRVHTKKIYSYEARWYNDTVDDICNLDNLNHYKKIAFDNIEKLKFL